MNSGEKEELFLPKCASDEEEEGRKRDEKSEKKNH